MNLTAADLQELKAALPLMPVREQEEILELLDAYEQVAGADAARKDLLTFCCAMQPDYKIGAHHRKLAGLLEAVEQRKKDRITVSVPPRMGKSQLCSIYFIAWYLGRNPTHKVMLVSHTTDLATDMGRKVRNVIATADYQRVFPGVSLAPDSKSAGRWNTNKGGEFVAAGVGSSIAGRGAHLLVCLHPDTRLRANFGDVTIKEIEEGQQILTRNGFQAVTKKLSTIHKKWYKINDVICSGEHKFMTPNGWCEAQQLRVGDHIVTVTFWRRLWLKLGSFLKPQHIKRGQV